MENRYNYWTFSLLIGFALSLFVAIFVCSGIPFVLYLFDRWQISTLNTIILYAMLFIVAKAGTQLQSRKQKPVRKPKKGADQNDAWAAPSESVSILSIVWSFVGIYAILWITPALIMYWIYLPPYPPEKIMLFTYFLSMATAVIYFFGNDEKFSTWKNKTAYFAGMCIGPAVVDYLFF